MSKLMKYNGFYGSVEFSMEDKVLHGKIECINDLVTYEATSAEEIEDAFHEAVDDYIETCELIGKEPEKPMAGTFNVRIGPDLHKAAYLAAKEAGISLNDFVKGAVSEKLETKQEVHMHLHLPKEDETDAVFKSDFSTRPLESKPTLSFSKTRAH